MDPRLYTVCTYIKQTPLAKRWKPNHDGIATRGRDKIKRVRRTKCSGAPSVTLPLADELGRAMLALNGKQRRFVLELATGPIGYGRLARAAWQHSLLRNAGDRCGCRFRV